MRSVLVGRLISQVPFATILLKVEWAIRNALYFLYAILSDTSPGPVKSAGISRSWISCNLNLSTVTVGVINGEGSSRGADMVGTDTVADVVA